MQDDGQPQPMTAEVLRGLIYAHNRANANTAAAHEANATLHALVELLVERGVMDGETFQARREQAAEQLRREYLERGMAVAMQEFGVSKYEFKGGAEIDCEDRLHLCKAACCRLPFALSKQDVQEGIVKWDLGQPYLNARTSRATAPIWSVARAAAPSIIIAPFRAGARLPEGQRIWLDFEKRVVNPRVADPDWTRDLEGKASPSANGGV